MKKFYTQNTELLEVLTEQGISFVCNEDMEMIITDEEAAKIEDLVIRFAPAAVNDYSIE